VRILVTGALGYIGLAVVRGLTGHSVVAFGREARNPAARAVLPEGARLMVGTLPGDAKRLFAEGTFDAVVHLAGGGGPKKSEADPVAAVRDNVEATTALLEAARGAGVRRLLFASTIAVYGTHREPSGPYQESDDPCPDDLYGAVKYAAERVWTSPALGRGTALRLANVYGAGAGVDLGVAGAVERFARAAATGGQISIFGTGAQRIDYVHIDDVVRAVRLCLEAPELPPAINIGSGAPVSISEMAETCAQIGASRGTAPKISRKDDPGGKVWPDRSLNIAHAAAALGWRPEVRFEHGMKELCEMMGQQRGS
jgi:UDP-glucose 4-epimerase